MGSYKGEYDEPHPGFPFTRFEVLYGDAGREHVVMFTPDCFVLRQWKNGAAGVWKVEITDPLRTGFWVLEFKIVPFAFPPSTRMALAIPTGPPKAPRVPAVPPPSGSGTGPGGKGWEGLGKETPINPWGKDPFGTFGKKKSWKDLGKTDIEDPWKQKPGSEWLPPGVIVVEGGLPGGPGFTGWFSDLASGYNPNGAGGSDEGGPSVVAVATGPGPSTETTSSSKPEREADNPDHPNSFTEESKNIYIYDDLHPDRKVSDGYPNPMGEVVGLSRDPFVAGLQRRALAFAGQFIPPPTGPSVAFTPDAGLGGRRDTSGAGDIDWSMLDPVGPVSYVEGVGPSRASGGARTNFQNPYIEALYPEGGTSGSDGEDDETLQMVNRFGGQPVPVPQDPPDPQAGGTTGGMLVAYSAGVTSPTIEFDAAGRVRRVTR